MSQFGAGVRKQYNEETSSAAELNSLLNEMDADIPKEEQDSLKQGEEFYAAEKTKSEEIGKSFDGMEPPEPEKPAGEEGNAFSQAFEQEKKKWVDAGRFTKSIAKGALKAVEDLGNGVHDLANLAEDYFAEKGLGDGKWINENDRLKLVDTPKAPEEAFAFMASRYLLPFGALAKGVRAAGLAGKAATTASVAGSGALTFLTTDPDEQGLADVLDSVPEVSWLVPDVLTSKPDDTRMEKRVKRAVEDMLLGLGAEGIIKGIGALGQKAAAAKKSKDAIKVIDDAVRAGEPGKVTQEAVDAVSGAKPPTDAQLGNLRKVEKALEEPFHPEIVSARHEELLQRSHLTEKEALELEALNKKGGLGSGGGGGKGRTGVGPEPIAEMHVAEAFGFENNSTLRTAFEDFKGGRISIEEAASRGAKLIDTVEKEEAFLKGFVPGQALNGDEISALTQLLNRYRVDQFLGGIKDVSKMTDAELIQFHALSTRTRQVATILTGGTSNAARTLRFAQEVFVGANDQKKIAMVESFVRIAGKDLKEQAKYMKAALDEGADVPELAKKLATRGTTHKMSEVFYSFWLNGVLGKLNTFFTNALGSFSTTVLHPLEAGISNVFQAKGTALREMHSVWEGQWAALSEAWLAAKQTFKDIEMPDGFLSSFDSKGSTLVPVADEAVEKYGLRGGWAKGIRALAFGAELPTRATSATDMFFKVINARARQHQYAFRLANGDAGMARNLLNNLPEELEMASIKFANKQTFSSGFQDVAFGQLGQGATNMLSGTLFGMGRIFVPFTRTITNLADTTMRYTPFAYLSSTIRGDLLAGGVRGAEAQAKVAVGSMVLMTGAGLGAAGILRGGGGKDYYSKKALRTDIQDDSLVIKNKYIPLKTLQPISNVLLMGADIANIMGYLADDEDDDKIANATKELVMVMMDRLTPDYLTGSVKEFFVNMSDLEQGRTGLHDLAGGAAKIASSAAPFRYLYVNNPFSSTKKKETAVDEDLGFLKSFYEQWRNNLFADLGWDKELPDQVNIFNEPVNIPPGFTMSLLSSFYTDAKEPDDVIMGLRKLGLDTHNIGHGSPTEQAFKIRMPERNVERGAYGKMVNYKMSPKEYNEFIGYMNEPLGGKNMKQHVRDVLAMPWGDERKKLEVKEVIEKHKRYAKEKFMFKTPDVVENYEKVRSERRKRLVGVEP